MILLFQFRRCVFIFLVWRTFGSLCCADIRAWALVLPPQVTWNLDQDFMPVAKGQFWLQSSPGENPKLEPPSVNTAKVNVKSWEEQSWSWRFQKITEKQNKWKHQMIKLVTRLHASDS